ncbi:hypothetical protein BJP40_06525 [Streptomyces sp. CC53]|uniref:hypothetical protein n=1 Tax=Streptomyces sp. CC53 TaxID=1906740 RepID=UPI0008DD9864|nr:hypothetical protein [Streptomyces sp. CC53]OII61177.1 hypothetical protein BJP40_06525 [Streptomyces sp. CC53]
MTDNPIKTYTYVFDIEEARRSLFRRPRYDLKVFLNVGDPYPYEHVGQQYGFRTYDQAYEAGRRAAQEDYERRLFEYWKDGQHGLVPKIPPSRKRVTYHPEGTDD